MVINQTRNQMCADLRNLYILLSNGYLMKNKTDCRENHKTKCPTFSPSGRKQASHLTGRKRPANALIIGQKPEPTF